MLLAGILAAALAACQDTNFPHRFSFVYEDDVEFETCYRGSGQNMEDYTGPDHCLVSDLFECCGLNKAEPSLYSECVSATSEKACTTYNSNYEW